MRMRFGKNALRSIVQKVKISKYVLCILFLNFSTKCMDQSCVDINKQLREAVEKNNLPEVILLLKSADINFQDSNYRDTILHQACFFGYCDIIKYLLAYGAKRNEENIHFFAPLRAAILSIQVEAVKILLEDPEVSVKKEYLEEAKKKAQELAQLAEKKPMLKVYQKNQLKMQNIVIMLNNHFEKNKNGIDT